MLREIFFCENNISKGLEEIIEGIKVNYPHVNIYIENCIGQCTECARLPFATMDAETITGDTPEELYNNIIEKLEIK